MEQTLGKRIMAHRKNMGLTQDALAEQLGVTAQAVSKWENDQSCPDITMLPKLAEVFGTTTDALLGVEPQETETVHEGEVVEEPLPTAADDEGSSGRQKEFEFKWHSGRAGALTLAVWVLLVGCISVAAQLMKWDASVWDILWPTAFLVFGVRRLLRGFSLFGLGSTCIGLYYLVSNLGLWNSRIDDGLLLSIILVVLGIGLVLNALRSPKRPHVHVHANGSRKAKRNQHIGGERFDCSASFCEDRQYISLPRLTDGAASVSFGEMVVDLSGVESVCEDCFIDLSCSFGEMILLVPRRYRVKPTSSTFFSSVSVSGQPDNDPAGTIRAETSVSFGEISIRYI